MEIPLRFSYFFFESKIPLVIFKESLSDEKLKKTEVEKLRIIHRLDFPIYLSRTACLIKL